MSLLETLYLLLKTKKLRKRGFLPGAITVLAMAAIAVACVVISYVATRLSCCKYYNEEWSRKFKNYLES
jgi:hypothetical protein